METTQEKEDAPKKRFRYAEKGTPKLAVVSLSSYIFFQITSLIAWLISSEIAVILQIIAGIFLLIMCIIVDTTFLFNRIKDFIEDCKIAKKIGWKEVKRIRKEEEEENIRYYRSFGIELSDDPNKEERKAAFKRLFE